MYGNPYMTMPPPWWMFNMPPPPNNSDMTPDQFMKFYKDMYELVQANKPKDEKKDGKPSPNKLDFGDHLVIICTVHSILAVIGTCAVLYYLTEFMKAVPHP